MKIGIPRALPHCPLQIWRAEGRQTDPQLLKEPHKRKKCSSATTCECRRSRLNLAEHIWKRKRDNRPNECESNSSSSGRVISSLWFNMMIDHLCPPTLSRIVMKVGPIQSELKLWSPGDRKTYLRVTFFIVKIHTPGPNTITPP